MSAKAAATKERHEKARAESGADAIRKPAVGLAGALAAGGGGGGTKEGEDKRKEPGAAISGAVKSAVKSAYKNVIKGKLALKGKPAPAIDKSKKKKAKALELLAEQYKSFLASNPSADKEEAFKTIVESALIKEEEDDAAAAAAAAAGNKSGSGGSGSAAAPDTRTKAERNFQAAQDAREKELLKSKLAKTHRQRIEVTTTTRSTNRPRWNDSEF